MRWFWGWCRWLWFCVFGPDDPVVNVNLYKRAKKQMMRECGLSPRQWKRFKKQTQREAKEEMRNGIRPAG